VDPSEPSRRVVAHRVRNRLIDYLEIAGSYAEQQRYAATVPKINVAYEIINQWEDWNPSDTFDSKDSEGVFDEDEIQALDRFGLVWKSAADSLPDDFPTIAEVQRLDEWNRLRHEATATLRVLSIRGRMPEHRETDTQ